MGEAKRRKKALGDQYGKTPAVLKDGSKQLEDHLEKFAQGLSDKMEAMGADLEIGDLEGEAAFEAIQNEITPEQARQKSDEIATWINDYLTPYRPQDREKLAIGLLNPIYEDIFEFAKSKIEDNSEDGSMDTFMMSVMHGLSTFSMVKSFLSPDNQEMFAGPMRKLYKMILEDVPESETEERDSLATLFEPCLT